MYLNTFQCIWPRSVAKLRISCHNLHIEKGRHRKTILERKCFLCGVAVEDEKHFVMECDSLLTHTNTFLMI